MRNRTLITISLGLAAASSLMAAETTEKAQKKAKKAYGEKQPWSDYQVHSMERPKPVKVKSGGAVTTKAPSDAIVIFDGSNMDALVRPWKIVDGNLVATPASKEKGKMGTGTKAEFSDCQIHIEWRVPAGRKVSSQKGGNSGVFIMGRYEVQVQESHTNVTYADGQAGAIYGQSPPLVNPSAPQGEWQSYDIIFKAPVYGEKGLETPAYITVIHNGVLIQNNQKIYGPTSHKRAAKYPKNHPEKGPINFQWHGDPIEYRNIWVRDLSKK